MLLEETIAVKDDGHSIVDWALRNKLTLVKYWKEGTWETEVSPNLGSNLVLEHLFQMSINLGSKKCGEIKTYTGRNCIKYRE